MPCNGGGNAPKCSGSSDYHGHVFRWFCGVDCLADYADETQESNARQRREVHCSIGIQRSRKTRSAHSNKLKYTFHFFPSKCGPGGCGGGGCSPGGICRLLIVALLGRISGRPDDSVMPFGGVFEELCLSTSLGRTGGGPTFGSWVLDADARRNMASSIPGICTPDYVEPF